LLEEALQGKAAIVTGAGSGLGEATATLLVRAGVSVAVVDLDIERAERVATVLRGERADSIALGVDVGDAHQVERAVGEALEAFGRIDFVINNAGTDYVLPISEMTVDQWDRVIGVNLRAAFLFAKAVLPIMERQGGGHIVNIASTAAKRAWSNASAYHASKVGAAGFHSSPGGGRSAFRGQGDGPGARRDADPLLRQAGSAARPDQAPGSVQRGADNPVRSCPTGRVRRAGSDRHTAQ